MHNAKINLLNEPDHVMEHSDRMLKAAAIGVDTEFVRERTYFPRPGLLQFSDGVEVWLADPIALADEPALEALIAEIMGRTGTTKILHSTGEDLEIIEMVGQSAPDPLFDTQRAAALLGWPLQLRYELLAKELLDIEFPGGLARNNWCRRPLPAAWIEYAANDVIALPAMREVLAEKLERAGRLEWLVEDCRRIVDRAKSEAEPEVRIKGAARLSDSQLERLSRLARWREKQARTRDLPRGFVVSDGAMLELARAGTASEADFERLAGGKQRPGKRDRDAIIEQLKAAPSDYSRPAELMGLSEDQRGQVKELQQIIGKIAADLGVEPAVIASKRDLVRKVQGVACDWLNGWRAQLLAARQAGS